MASRETPQYNGRRAGGNRLFAVLDPDRPFDPAPPPQELRQPRERGDGPSPGPDLDRRIAAVGPAGLEVVVHAGLGGDLDAVAHPQMTGGPDLAAEHDAVAERR